MTGVRATGRQNPHLLLRTEEKAREREPERSHRRTQDESSASLLVEEVTPTKLRRRVVVSLSTLLPQTKYFQQKNARKALQQAALRRLLIFQNRSE
ncbi:hypothetical protein CRENBAI_007396 [Crenichthys baileyi]|uniref:Uncharacterized protein n=1 Tax=Crenichthys baileyi TaxID=28760 RepID=A0AAV9S0U6_9TELE